MRECVRAAEREDARLRAFQRGCDLQQEDAAVGRQMRLAVTRADRPEDPERDRQAAALEVERLRARCGLFFLGVRARTLRMRQVSTRALRDHESVRRGATCARAFRTPASLAAAIALVAASACAEQERPPESPIEQLRSRAENDLRCSAAEIHSKTLDDRTRVAWGCGRRATYVQSCEACGQDGYSVRAFGGVSDVHTKTARCNCTWLLNSPVESD